MKIKQWICFLSIVLLIGAPIAVYFLQSNSPQPVEFPLTLMVTKIDKTGKASNELPMYVEGEKGESPAGIPYLNIKIASFDRIVDIESITDGTNTLSEIQTFPNSDIGYIICVGYRSGTSKVVPVNLYFSQDLQRWLFYNMTDDVYYIASANNQYTTQELYEYFSPIIVGS